MEKQEAREPYLTADDRILIVGLAMGISQAEIAVQLDMGAQSVKEDLGEIRARFGVGKSIQVVFQSIDRGLIGLNELNIKDYNFSRFEKLTPKEKEMLATVRKVAESTKNEDPKETEEDENVVCKNVAKRLNITSVQQVKNRLHNIYGKLQATNIIRAMVLDIAREKREKASAYAEGFGLV